MVKTCLLVCLCVNQCGSNQPLDEETCNLAQGLGHPPRTICHRYSNCIFSVQKINPLPENSPPKQTPRHFPKNFLHGNFKPQQCSPWETDTPRQIHLVGKNSGHLSSGKFMPPDISGAFSREKSPMHNFPKLPAKHHCSFAACCLVQIVVCFWIFWAFEV